MQGIVAALATLQDSSNIDLQMYGCEFIQQGTGPLYS